jgi:phage shock protein PspC (stress-responsive transcriptional regulator)
MQRIAIVVRLNRGVLQFDEAACAHLEQFLAESAGLLEGDPNPQEILADLEQAVADQCVQRLRPGQSVVTLAELIPALDQIGTVQTSGDGSAADSASAFASASASTTPPRPAQASPALRQISQGALISGVCLGLARYFGLDTTLMRVAFVLLLFLTQGAMIAVYLALMLVMPFAPLDPNAEPVNWLPQKCRNGVEWLRAKFGFGRPDKIAA